MRWFGGITDSVDMRLGRLQETVKAQKGWRAAVRGVAKSRTRLSDWTPAMKDAAHAPGPLGAFSHSLFHNTLVGVLRSDCNITRIFQLMRWK